MPVSPTSTLVLKLVAAIVILVVLLVGFSLPIGRLPPLGGLLNPVGGVYGSALSAAYPASFEVISPHVSDDVVVIRDRFGIPHIYGRTIEDVAFALGYLHAKDRLWQMDLQRRLASGRLAEVLGPDLLKQDMLMRKIGLLRAAERSLDALRATDPAVIRMLEAGANGVNHFLQEAGENLPLEFKLLGYRPEPWRPLDALLWAKMMAWFLSGSFDDLKMKLIWDRLGEASVIELFPIERPLQIPVIPDESLPPRVQPKTPFTEVNDITFDITEAIKDILQLSGESVDLLGVAESYASNNWVVDGSKSLSGKPLLANDPHLAITLPPIWYEAHLVSADMDVYGVTFPGVPAVVLGYNRFIAWGFTNVGADVIDYFVERVNPANPEQYWFDGAWRNFTKRVEVIRVKGGADISLVVYETVHGPVLTQQGATISMRWTGSDPTFEARAIFKLNRAKNYSDFLEAVKDFSVPAQNIVYADVEGNIALWVTGRFPIRKNGIGLLPHSGATGEFEWIGFVPFDELPHAFNPGQHYLASANQKSTGAAYPYYLSTVGYDPGYRGRRINALLSGPQKFSVEDMKRFQADNVDVAASSFLPRLLLFVEAEAFYDQQTQPVLGLMKMWNYVMSKDMVAPTVWRVWFEKFWHAVFDDEWERAKITGLPLPPVDVLEALVAKGESRWFDDVRTARVEALRDLALLSFQQTVEQLRKDLGEDPASWTWGAWHRMDIRHLSGLQALSYPKTPRDGSEFTLNAAGGRDVRSGPSWRMVIDMARVEQAEGVVPGGQSGAPFLPHYNDQIPLWLNYQYRRLLFPADPSAFPAHEVESRIVFRGG